MTLASFFKRLTDSSPTPTVPAPIGKLQDVKYRRQGFPRGPVQGSRLIPDFVREVGRVAYLWAWPLVNIHNRHWTQDWVKTKFFLVGGVAPIAPVNRLAMLTDYNDPGQRYITCPSQDLIYGFGVLDLGRAPVVVQVPDFSGRFFVFQATDQRTDAFSEMGSMYATKQGFYLLSGPIGKARHPPASPPRFAARPISAQSSRVFSRLTIVPTTRRCSRCFARSWPTPCWSSMGR